MITIQKVTSNVQSVRRQSPDIYWHAELCSRRPCSVQPSVIPNSNYVIMVGDRNCLKYCIFACFLYCKRQVHRDFVIILYNYRLITSTGKKISEWCRGKYTEGCHRGLICGTLIGLVGRNEEHPFQSKSEYSASWQILRGTPEYTSFVFSVNLQYM